jgi:hypothetical protein
MQLQWLDLDFIIPQKLKQLQIVPNGTNITQGISFPLSHLYIDSFLYRNQKSICRRSREKYRKSLSKPSTSVAYPAPIPSTFQQICSIEKEHSKIIRYNLHEYLSGIYSDYCREGSNSAITNPLRPIEILCDDAQRLHNEILREDGLSLAWKKADEVCKQLRKTRTMIEDIYCYALEGSNEVKEAHKQGKLMYQSL